VCARVHACVQRLRSLVVWHGDRLRQNLRASAASLGTAVGTESLHMKNTRRETARKRATFSVKQP